MSEFSLGQFLTKIIDYSLSGIKGTSTEAIPKPQSQVAGESFSKNLAPKSQPKMPISQQPNVLLAPVQNLQTNHLEALDKALYAKDLMKLPKEMSELINFVRKNFNSQVGLASVVNSGIDLAQMALFLQQNGKEAVNKLIMAMSSASKQGLEDLTIMKDTMKLINASVSLAEQNNPSQVVKSLVLLYLPWVPSQQGADFEIEIEGSDAGGEGSESSITVMISTKNYGNVKAVLLLQPGNLFTVFFTCSDTFPKEELLRRIKAEGAIHSIRPTFVVEQQVAAKNESEIRQSKINVSNNMTINPVLVLMAHAIIRHTFEIDND